MNTYKITWRGNQNTNYSSREEVIPEIIVNHISAGTANRCDSWFRSSGNKVSSAHFLVTITGEIYQYVRIEDMAWANGIPLYNIPKAQSSFIRSQNINPNLYSVSIEHEGTTGKLTEEQFNATLWLHRYISNYVKEKWKQEIILDRDHILGHYQIDPIRKPNCPGAEFPWERLIEELGKAPKVKTGEKWKYDGIEYLNQKGLLSDLGGWERNFPSRYRFGRCVW